MALNAIMGLLCLFVMNSKDNEKIFRFSTSEFGQSRFSFKPKSREENKRTPIAPQ